MTVKQSIVSLQHVDKWYGENHVVKDLNLEILEGEFPRAAEKRQRCA